MRSLEAAESIAKTILIVDDVPANLEVVSRHLESHGYRAVVAQGGKEGIERAELVQPDLILLDVLMPGARRLRDLPAPEGERDHARHPGDLHDGADRHRPTSSPASRSARSTT